MITNLEATIGYIIMTVISLVLGYVPTGIIIGFCVLEVFLHTWFGTAMYFRLKSKEKTTIYGPGSITAYLGFGFFGVLLCHTMTGRSVGAMDIVIAVILLAWIALCCILIPENLIKKKTTITTLNQTDISIDLKSNYSHESHKQRQLLLRGQTISHWHSVSTVTIITEVII